MRYQPYASAPTAFPYLRSAIRPDLAELPDTELAEALDREFGWNAAAAEDFFSDIGKRLPSIATGALTGIGMGAGAGPLGALLGGLGGAVFGGLTAPTAPGPAAPGPPPPPAPGSSPLPRSRRTRLGTGRRRAVVGPEPRGGEEPPPLGEPPSGVGASLAALLADPTLQQSVMQLALGPGANPQVELPSGQQVPAAAFAELLREAADQVLAEQEALGLAESAEDLPEYLAEAERYRRGSSLDPALRAAVLLRLLEQPYRSWPGAVPVTPVEPYAPAIPATPSPQYAFPGGPVAAGPTSGPGAPAGPVGPGTLFPGYQPPDLGAPGPTRYSLDEVQRAEAEQAEDAWDFEQSLDDILGAVEPR